jgi:mRNA interferase MazF
MKKGEIRLVEIPGLGGRSQNGMRPALVIADKNLPVVVVVPLTSNLQALRFSHTIRLSATNKNGLSADSVALIFQLLAVDRRFFRELLGCLDEQAIKKIDRALLDLLGL